MSLRFRLTARKNIEAETKANQQTVHIHHTLYPAVVSEARSHISGSYIRMCSTIQPPCRASSFFLKLWHTEMRNFHLNRLWNYTSHFNVVCSLLLLTLHMLMHHLSVKFQMPVHIRTTTCNTFVITYLPVDN